MTPFCPVCRKRVEDKRHFTGGIYANPENYCPECGVVFCPNVSERLAPKCSCGADLDMPPINTLAWTGQTPICEKCRKEKP